MRSLKDWRLLAAIFITAPLIIVFIKIFYYGYDFRDVIPHKGYKLTLSITTNNKRPEKVKIHTFAPPNNRKQTVTKSQDVSDSFSYSVKSDSEDDNQRVTWKSGKISGDNRMVYVAYIDSRHIKYVFNNDTQINSFIPDKIKKYLKGDPEGYPNHPTQSQKQIQTDSPAIKKKLAEITANATTLYEKLKAVHNYITKDIRYVDFAGVLDAESCQLLGEGSCNGKSRLFVAMAQNLGLPARLVGGIILNKSPKKVTHQWVEVFINGQWVPFCPTNNYFAELPKNYIALYYGDQALFSRTAHIKFNYSYSFETITVAGENLRQKFKDLPINIYGFISQFDKFKLSLDNFIYLLMLPMAALISVILKNIVGLETFGTFLPILIASVLGNTGVITGLLVFFGIIWFVYLINTMISKLDLLYHPRMAILLSFVILALLIVFSMGLRFKFYNLVYVVFFPVAIVAITINRVTMLMEEASYRRIGIISINTIVVTIVSYFFIKSIFLQMLMLSFPELILLLIGINIMVGRWAGFRLFEYWRFREMIRNHVW